MKQKIILITLIAAIVFAGCQPEDLKDFEARDNGTVSKLFGTWTGKGVTQRDIGAEAKGFPYKTEDMTEALGFTSVKVTLNGTGTTASDFDIDYGTGTAFFPFSEGTWAVDDVNKVGRVWLVNAAKTDTVTLFMGSYQYSFNNEAFFTQIKTLLGSPAIVYEYKFSK